MSLLDAAKDDIASAIRQESEIRLFSKGVSTGGRGLNIQQRKAITYKAGLKRAHAYAKELHLQTATYHPTFIPKSGKHRPPNRRPKSVVRGQRQSVSACEGTIKLANKIIRTSAKRRKAVIAAKSQKQFQVVLFESVVNLKKCYGCGKVFCTMYTKPPRNLVLKHFCHRKYLNKDGVEVTSKQLQTAYFHLNLNCTRKCKPDM